MNEIIPFLSFVVLVLGIIASFGFAVSGSFDSLYLLSHNDKLSDFDCSQLDVLWQNQLSSWNAPLREKFANDCLNDCPSIQEYDYPKIRTNGFASNQYFFQSFEYDMCQMNCDDLKDFYKAFKEDDVYEKYLNQCTDLTNSANPSSYEMRNGERGDNNP